jgi:excisionase family DNA binding protein
VSSSAPFAREEARESQEVAAAEISVNTAARIAKCSPDTVRRWIEEGAIAARRTSLRGWWKINAESLSRYLRSSDGKSGSVDGAKTSRALPSPVASPKLAEHAACPEGFCSAHWERRARIVPAVRAGLCKRCLSGRPLLTKADGGAELARPSIRMEQKQMIRETMEEDRDGVAQGDESKGINVSTSARIAKCSPDTVRRWIEEGAIEARRVSPRGWWKVEHNSLIRYLDRWANNANSAESGQHDREECASIRRNGLGGVTP